MSRRRHEASQAKGHARGHQPQPITIRLRRESSQSGQKHRLADSPRAGLVSIVEPEVDIHSPRKTEAERQLRTGIRAELDRLLGQVLEAAGANAQRPLWASTGVKDPNLPDTLYVAGLVAANVVNTMPEKTLDAMADHGVVEGDTITGSYAEAADVLDKLDALGVSYQEVVEKLETEGLDKFVTSWSELLETVQTALDAAKG